MDDWPQADARWRDAELAETVALLERDHARYRNDAVAWAVDVLHVARETIAWSEHPEYAAYTWDGTIDPLVCMADGLAASRDVGVESGTGTGKSYWAACLILWFLACWEDARVFTFAPKEDQLKLYIWKEIGRLWPAFLRHFPEAKLGSLRIRMRGDIKQDVGWGADGYAVGVGVDEQIATKAQGMHGEHMLLVYEETPGIHPAILAAGENTCTAPHNLRLAIGNPDHQLDALHTFCRSPGVLHIRMSAYDHPNVVRRNPSIVPGAVSQQSIDRRLARHRSTDPLFMSRVRGISPEQAADSLIRLEWLEAAAARYEQRLDAGTVPDSPIALGVDVANSEHGDLATIAEFRGTVLTALSGDHCPNANVLGHQVFQRMVRDRIDQRYVGVDPIGVGAGTVNELARLGKPAIRRLNASFAPVAHGEKAPDGGTMDWAPDANMHRNLRSQMWWQLREDLRLGRLDLPRDEALWAELIAPGYEIKLGKVVVESKDELRQRLGRSPDRADAVVMANWVRPRLKMVAKPEDVSHIDDRSPHYDYAGRRHERKSVEQELDEVLSRGQGKITHREHWGTPWPSQTKRAAR